MQRMISDLSRLRAASTKFGRRVAGNLVRRRIYRKLGYRFPIGHSPSPRPWDNDYRMWVKNHGTLTPRQRSNISERIEKMQVRPRFSIVMPVYNPSPEFLREAVDSVRGQLYPDWELCIADDASTDPAVQDILREYLALDSRVKVAFRATNGHISASSNTAVAMATSPWIVLMDHDDKLSEEALFCVAQCISEFPDARLIYSDEDKIDEKGQRSDPYFKPDWNLDLFRSHNMFSHLGVLSTELVRRVGGFRKGFEGSQDWDLVLRCMEQVDPSQIKHVPRVLYHWRIHSQSTAFSIDAKPYATKAAERALNEHYLRTGVDAVASSAEAGYRTRFALPKVHPLVSIIIPTRNARQLLQRCIESIQRKTNYENYEIIVVDNGSDEASAHSYLKKIAGQPKVRVLRDDRPFNYSALNNAAVRVSQGEFIALLNNDIEVVSEDWLSEMVSLASQSGIGPVGARLWYPDLTLQHGGVILGPGGLAVHAHKGFAPTQFGHAGRAALTQSFSAVTAACLVVRKALYERVGGLDEINLEVAFNDVDFCLRLGDLGFRSVWTPYAELLHHESATRGDDLAPKHRQRLQKEIDYMRGRWAPMIANDPAYSPNLTVDAEDFSYAWPPRTELI